MISLGELKVIEEMKASEYIICPHVIPVRVRVRVRVCVCVCVCVCSSV